MINYSEKEMKVIDGIMKLFDENQLSYIQALGIANWLEFKMRMFMSDNDRADFRKFLEEQKKKQEAEEKKKDV